MNSLSSILQSEEQASWLQYGDKWMYWDDPQGVWCVRKMDGDPSARNRSIVLYWGPSFVEAIDVLTRKEKKS